MKYLESNAGISGGQPVLKGTRIRVSHLLSKLLAGQTIEQIHTEWYPSIPLATLRGAVQEAITAFDQSAHV
jgi:uncharacterized protein (DUF433 family)